MTRSRARTGRSGFTLFEVIVVVAAIAILALILTPLVRNFLADSRVSRAHGDVETIAAAVATLHTDTTRWPYTNANGPAGVSVTRLVSSPHVATGTAEGAGSDAARWGTWGTAKHLGDFLYWNNPDNDSGADGANANEADADYATSGPNAWKGPYLESYDVDDPWGHAYVVNVRYLPGGGYEGDQRHRVLVLSAGPDGRWSTPLSDGVTEEIRGDDIGYVVHVTD